MLDTHRVYGIATYFYRNATAIQHGIQKHLGFKKSGVAKKNYYTTKRTDIGMWPKLMYPACTGKL